MLKKFKIAKIVKIEVREKYITEKQKSLFQTKLKQALSNEMIYFIELKLCMSDH